MKLDELINTPKPMKGKRVYMSFSIGSTPIEVKSLPGSINFSENPKLALFESELTNFTLLELIRVSKMNPRVVLDRRVREVVRLANGMSRDKLADNKYTINNYLNQYMMEIILRAMSNPKATQINLMYLLGLQRYISNLNPIRNLQRLLVRIKKIQNSTGFISKIYQTQLKKLYAEVWNEFITGIEDKYLPEEKRGILSGRSDVNYDAENDSKLEIAAFSNNICKIRDIIESILMKSDTVDDSILKELSNIKLDNKLTKELMMSPVFGDNELTELIINYITKGDDKLIKYTNKEFNYRFSTNPIIEFFSDSSPQTYQTGVQWSPDHNQAYLMAPQMNCWFLFDISKTEANKYLLTIRKFNSNINYALVGYTDEEIKKLTSVAELFGSYTFNLMADLLDEFNNIVNNISKKSSTFNFSKNKAYWTTLGPDMRIGYLDSGNNWRVFLIYVADAGNFIEEFELDKKKYKSIPDIGLEDIMDQSPINRMRFKGSLDYAVRDVETNLIK